MGNNDRKNNKLEGKGEKETPINEGNRRKRIEEKSR